MLTYKKKGCVHYASTSLLTIGSERRNLDDGGWYSRQSASNQHVLAFSLLPVKVVFEGHRSIVLAPQTVAMTRPWGGYTRTPLSDLGQRTVFFSMDTDTARQSVMDYDQSVMDREDPFPARNGPSSARALGMARQLERLVFETNGIHDSLEFDEVALQIISVSMKAYYSSESRSGKSLSRPRQRERIHQAIVMMCLEPSKNWSLRELASMVSLSPAYLSRVFKRYTGRTLSQCLRLIRVSHALEQLPDRRRDLTRLALECGFASHAHMSSTFMETLGAAPSSLAKSSPQAISESLAKILASISQN